LDAEIADNCDVLD